MSSEPNWEYELKNENGHATHVHTFNGSNLTATYKLIPTPKNRSLHLTIQDANSTVKFEIINRNKKIVIQRATETRGNKSTEIPENKQRDLFNDLLVCAKYDGHPNLNAHSDRLKNLRRIDAYFARKANNKASAKTFPKLAENLPPGGKKNIAQ